MKTHMNKLRKAHTTTITTTIALTFVTFAVLLLAFIAISGCSQTQQPTQQPAQQAAQQQTQPAAKQPIQQSPTIKLSDENPSTTTQEITMKIIIGGFEPEKIVVKKGVPVKITITSTEIDPDPKFKAHGFAIEELGINEVVEIGQTKVIEFTPTKTGSYVYFCSVYCGKGHMGQNGIMEVVD